MEHLLISIATNARHHYCAQAQLYSLHAVTLAR